MSISNQEIHATITPLRLIFWGGLMGIFDFTFSSIVSGAGWKFDIINDFVGMVMITWGVYQLGKIELNAPYRKAMKFVMVVAVLSCLDAFQSHFIYNTPTLLAFLLTLLSLLVLAAMVVFCIAMRWLCSNAGLERSEQSWKTTTLLFVFIYAVPLGLFYLAAAIAISTNSSFHIDLDPAGLLLMPVFCIPLLHLFVSTSRMKADAEARAQTGPQAAAMD